MTPLSHDGQGCIMDGMDGRPGFKRLLGQSNNAELVEKIVRRVDKLVRCYDNEGRSSDRYTVVFTGRYRHKTGGSFRHVGMSASPFHPQGFGQHGESTRHIDVNKWGFAPMIGRSNHLGKRIPFAALPDDCRKLVVQDLLNLWNGGAK